MRGYLTDNFIVKLDPETALIGGSWHGGPENDQSPSDPALLRIVDAHCQATARPILFDIGACTGNFSLMAAKHPHLTVHAFEPHDRAYYTLLRNIDLNGLADRVTAYRLAVSDQPGGGALWIPPEGSNQGLARCIRESGYAVQPVTFISLDTFALPEPTIIKLDIEGMEYHALKGGKHLIRSARPELLLECSTYMTGLFDYTVEEVVSLLEAWGMEVAWPSDGNIHAVWPRRHWPFVSIVIPTYKRPDRIQRCLKAIERTIAQDIRYEVIVVEDHDDTAPLDLEMRLGHGTVRWFHNTPRKGAVACWNQGLAAARGHYLVFFNDDCEPEPGWLEAALVAHTKYLNGYGVVGFNDGYQDGNELAVQYLFDRPFCKDHLGGVMAYPVYEFAWNDTETNERAKRAGRFYWCKEAVVQHRHWSRENNRDALNDENMEKQGRDGYIFYARKEAGFPDNFDPVI